MPHVVIDTNVILAANKQHKDLSPECVTACMLRLAEIQSAGIVVIDDLFRILGEYLHKTQPNQAKGVGDVFLKWLLQNKSNASRCHEVTLTEGPPSEFVEFPLPALASIFDPPDRKFVAAANKHPNKPKILQASDCKWLNWHGQLAAAHITVEFICPADVCRFYARKFPGQPVPAI